MKNGKPPKKRIAQTSMHLVPLLPKQLRWPQIKRGIIIITVLNVARNSNFIFLLLSPQVNFTANAKLHNYPFAQDYKVPKLVHLFQDIHLMFQCRLSHKIHYRNQSICKIRKKSCCELTAYWFAIYFNLLKLASVHIGTT